MDKESAKLWPLGADFHDLRNLTTTLSSAADKAASRMAYARTWKEWCQYRELWHELRHLADDAAYILEAVFLDEMVNPVAAVSA